MIVTQELESHIKCSCGSTISKKSMSRHQRTKRHVEYLETGVPKTTISSAEYQRIRFQRDPALRQKQRAICQDYYECHKGQIRLRQESYRAKKRAEILL